MEASSDLVDSEKQTDGSGSGDRRRTVEYAGPLGRRSLAAAQNRDLPSRQVADGVGRRQPAVGKASRQSRWDPFRPGPTVGRQETQSHVVDVELAAAIVVYDVEPHADLRCAGERRHQIGMIEDVVDEPVREPSRLGQTFGDRFPKARLEVEGT